MRHHLVIDGNAFYEVDDDCMARKKQVQEEGQKLAWEDKDKKTQKGKSAGPGMKK